MSTTLEPTKKAPIPDDLPPVPGQSLGERWRELFDENVVPWVGVVVGIWLVALLEWVGYLFSIPRHPIQFTLVAVGATLLGLRSIRRLRPLLRQIKQGMRGEQYVGRYLDGNVPAGYKVIHDLEEDGYNIDHVIVGPGGIYALETKTISKPRGDHRVVYDGNRVTVNGYAPDRDPVQQARAAAGRVREVLKNTTGRDVSCDPSCSTPAGMWRSSLTAWRFGCLSPRPSSASSDMRRAASRPRTLLSITPACRNTRAGR